MPLTSRLAFAGGRVSYAEGCEVFSWSPMARYFSNGPRQGSDHATSVPKKLLRMGEPRSQDARDKTIAIAEVAWGPCVVCAAL